VSGMNSKKILACLVAFFVVAAAVVLPPQARGMEEDEWSSENKEDRFSGLPRKTGTFFQRARKDSPAEQLAYAAELKLEGRLRKAGRQFNALVHRWPDVDEAAEAQLALARALRARGRYEAAFREYQYLIEHYAGQFPYTMVLNEQLGVARSVMTMRRGTFGFLQGFESPDRAIPLFRIVIENGPNWSEIPEIRLVIGRIHEEAREYIEAVAAYEEVIVFHGRHPVAQEAIFRKAICLERIANKNPRDTRRTQVAMQALFAALREDLAPEQAAEAQELIRGLRTRLERIHLDQAEYYDRTLKNPSAALLSYRDFLRRFPESEHEADVRQRVEVLEAKASK
jgi:outer membrane protein assembly factor BamD (BamD/ComL family)